MFSSPVELEAHACWSSDVLLRLANHQMAMKLSIKSGKVTCSYMGSYTFTANTQYVPIELPVVAFGRSLSVGRGFPIIGNRHI